jgi:hypothetical protein
MSNITSVRVLKSTRDELDVVHKELRLKDSRFTSKDVVLLELVKVYYFVKTSMNKDEDSDYDVE